MGWFDQKELAPRIIPSRLDNDPDYEKWKHLEPNIEFLVIVTDEFIVYVDRDIDVDWSLRDEKFDADRPEFQAVLNCVAALETKPCAELPRTMKLHFKRLLGEGLARAFGNDFKGAQSVLKSAEEYIEARNEETSRFWYLSGSAVTAIPIIVLGCVLWLGRSWLQANIGSLAFWELLSACAGGVGAFLSVIGRTGKQRFDCSAGKPLHYLEASSRIIAGAICGVAVGLAVHSQLILTAITKNGNLPAITVLAALVSGLSERFVDSIIVDLGVGRSHKIKEGAGHD